MMEHRDVNRKITFLFSIFIMLNGLIKCDKVYLFFIELY
uniref:Uncharacterized protein n=1 Tax=Strongyloides papillosus TaxID=174720 RepID=A0A0N5B768_STREA